MLMVIEIFLGGPVSEIRERERESIEIDLGKSTGMIFCDSDYHIVQADSANNY